MQALRKAKALVDAVQAENVGETRSILVEGANANLILPDGVSPFHLAVGVECEDALEFVKVMLQFGADPNVRSTEGMTPVLIAAAYGRYQALCLLLDMGGDPTLTDDSGKDALEYARDSQSWDCINILKEWRRQDPEDTSLHIADTDSESSSSTIFHTIPAAGKVISETYLATKQGFDVTSPDHPLWFFKGSPGTTVLECSSLDKTVAFPSRFDDTSSRLDDSRPSTPSTSLGFVTCHDDPRKLAFNDNSSLMTLDASELNLPPPPPPSENSSPWSRNNDSSDHRTSLLNDSSPMMSSDTSSSGEVSESYTISFLPSTNSSLATSRCSLSNNSVLSQLIEETSTQFVHHDTEAETVIIERQCPSASMLGLDASGIDMTHENTIIYDWKEYQSIQTCSSVQVHDKSLNQLTDHELREHLTNFGYNVGPITKTTRRVYLQKLSSLRSDPEAQKQLAAGAKQIKQGFRYELASYLNGSLTLPPNMAALEAEMQSEYDKKDNWREGKVKSSFNYLLLDPRVTNNLPLRFTHMTELEVFTTFVSAIFYVGKGKRNRPYAHFNEALHYLKSDKEKKPGQKVGHILDVWNDGDGVVSLHCFQNVIPVEAYTRESCMIDVIGLKRLTNSIKGNYYGTPSTWTASNQRLMGIYLLKKACQIFLVEGERQIRPGDIQGW